MTKYDILYPICGPKYLTNMMKFGTALREYIIWLFDRSFPPIISRNATHSGLNCTCLAVIFFISATVSQPLTLIRARKVDECDEHKVMLNVVALAIAGATVATFNADFLVVFFRSCDCKSGKSRLLFE